MHVPQRIYISASGAVVNPKEHKTTRFHFSEIGRLGSAIYVETAAIPTRTLTSVGGIRENRRYSRKKARKWGVARRTITPIMLVAVANEIAARRARNRSAATSRRINRRGSK